MKTKFYLLTAGLLAAVMVFAQPSGSGKSGKFSVAAGVQVRFAQGNLQFNPSQGTHATAEGTASGTWRFAEQQYESFQDENVNIVNAGYNGWLDLFGWGTSGYNSCSPLTYLPDATYGDGNLDIAGTYYDWGVYNAISNGGNKVGLWRTLTESEWEYLTLNRANAANLWSLARVNNIDGLLILPDDWSLPSGLSFSPQQQYPSHNAYTLEQWQQMENAGAVFLPAEGYRSYNTSTSQVTVKTFTGVIRPLHVQLPPSVIPLLYCLLRLRLLRTGRETKMKVGQFVWRAQLRNIRLSSKTGTARCYPTGTWSTALPRHLLPIRHARDSPSLHGGLRLAG